MVVEFTKSVTSMPFSIPAGLLSGGPRAVRSVSSPLFMVFVNIPFMVPDSVCPSIGGASG